VSTIHLHKDRGAADRAAGRVGIASELDIRCAKSDCGTAVGIRETRFRGCQRAAGRGVTTSTSVAIVPNGENVVGQPAGIVEVRAAGDMKAGGSWAAQTREG
jgi:hypothetical protein